MRFYRRTAPIYNNRRQDEALYSNPAIYAERCRSGVIPVVQTKTPFTKFWWETNQAEAASAAVENKPTSNEGRTENE